MVGGKVNYTLANVVLVGWLASCAGSPLGTTVERSLEADPQLEESPAFDETSEAKQTEQNTPEPDVLAEEKDAPQTDAPTRRSNDSGTSNGETSNDTNQEEPSAADIVTDDAPDSEVEQPYLEGVPADLQAYVQDLQAVDLLAIQVSSAASSEPAPKSEATSPFNEAITRREYAQWLFQVHNALYIDEPGVRLRAGLASDEPVFQDVPPQDPDFGAIQGLAEAGIIPSALTGSSTAINFRPNAPLTREILILWKVPLDRRAPLPETSPETIAETWGFQDVASIEPFALRAIAADFQLGDFSSIRRAFGYTTLFRPDKAVTRAEAAAVIWRFGTQTDGRSAKELRLDREAE